MQRDVARWFLVVLTLLVVGISLFEPASLNYRLVEHGGFAAEAALAGLFAISALCAVALLQEEFSRYADSWICRNAYLFWALMAVGYVIFAAAVVDRHEGWWLVAVWGAYAAACLRIAFSELAWKLKGAE